MADAADEAIDEAVVASAPGRVNLIGEHTDYNDGFVLPLVIPQRTVVRLQPRTDSIVAAESVGMSVTPATFVLGAESRRGDWIDYLQGCTSALRAAGHAIDGCDVRVRSTIPAGAGLASSAALTVAFLRALRHANGLPLDDLALAQLAHHAETQFVGVQSGIMDQMAASVGVDGEALLLDCRSLDVDSIPWPLSWALVVIDSGTRHAHVSGDYNQRRDECRAACAALGVESLRALTATDMDRIATLPDPLARRARHVVSENQRVHDAVAALRSEDATQLGHLFDASHQSMRDDYDVSTPVIDRLIAAATADAAVFGARLTGGGFGGSIIVLTRAGEGAAVGQRICDAVAADARVVAVLGD